MRKSVGGFTIVELLIVIVVIAILAAITVVAFNGVQNRANDSAVQHDLTSFARKIKLFEAENGFYPTTYAHFSNMGLRVAKNAYDPYFNGTANFNLVYCYRPSVNPTAFALVAYGKSGKNYQYNGSGQLIEYPGVKTGSVVACGNAGVPLDSAADRFWFYDNNVWQPFL